MKFYPGDDFCETFESDSSGILGPVPLETRHVTDQIHWKQYK